MSPTKVAELPAERGYVHQNSKSAGKTCLNFVSLKIFSPKTIGPQHQNSTSELSQGLPLRSGLPGVKTKTPAPDSVTSHTHTRRWFYEGGPEPEKLPADEAGAGRSLFCFFCPFREEHIGGWGPLFSLFLFRGPLVFCFFLFSLFVVCFPFSGPHGGKIRRAQVASGLEETVGWNWQEGGSVGESRWFLSF